MVWPAAEIELDEDQVRSLLTAQHHDLACHPLELLDAGWDNTLWRIGDDLLLRLPRRQAAVELMRNEQRWLPELREVLPIPIPAPVRFGRPSELFPWPWSIVPWIDGLPADRHPLSNPTESAEGLAGFLAALHRPAPPDAPHNPVRGVPISERSESFEIWMSRLADEIDATVLRRVWDYACSAAPWGKPSVWLHGDLHPANVLLGDRGIAGVVDFGDICAGDPATDLAALYMLLPRSAQDAFTSTYGDLEADLEARALGWAAHLGLVLLGSGLDESVGGKPTYATVGRTTLSRVIERFKELGGNGAPRRGKRR